jgi:hypothetical protein
MKLFKVKYFIFGEPCFAAVKAENEKEAINVLETRFKDNDYSFTLRDIEDLDNYDKGILLSVFE